MLFARNLIVLARLLLRCISSLYIALDIAYLLSELKAPWQPSPLGIEGALRIGYSVYLHLGLCCV